MLPLRPYEWRPSEEAGRTGTAKPGQARVEPHQGVGGSGELPYCSRLRALCRPPTNPSYAPCCAAPACSCASSATLAPITLVGRLKNMTQHVSARPIQLTTERGHQIASQHGTTSPPPNQNTPQNKQQAAPWDEAQGATPPHCFHRHTRAHTAADTVPHTNDRRAEPPTI